jgi:3-phosphoshikimate 1-carboxyvinyltransferase
MAMDQPQPEPSAGAGSSLEAGRGWATDSRISGTIRVPSSKSIAQRALVLAALCEGNTRFAALPNGRDVQHLLGALDALGVEVQPTGQGTLTLRGVGADGLGHLRSNDVLCVNVGESGTAARVITAAVAIAGCPGLRARVEGCGSLTRRRSLPLLECLGRAIPSAGDGGWPVQVRAISPPSELTLRAPCSSQEVTGLLIALCAHAGERTLLVQGRIPSQPYVDLTLDVLGVFGVRTRTDMTHAGVQFTIQGPAAPPRGDLLIEADASAAAVALAAACLSGGAARVEGVGAQSAQGDVRIVEILQSFGCEARAGAQHLEASGAPTKSVDLDLVGTPDLAPIAAILAAAATRGGADTCRLTGLGTLPGKESSRIEVLAQGLCALGWSVGADSNSLTIGAGESRKEEVVLDTAGDHRMVFALSLLGLIQPGVRVAHADAVTKSWPAYWDDLAAAGARALS